MIEAVVYDFGGVLVEIDFDRVFHRWAMLAAVPFERVKSRFTHGAAYQAHERGEIDARAYYQSLRAELGIDLDDAAFTDGWNEVFAREIAPTVELVKRLGPTVPQYLFSNTNPTHHACWSARYARALAPLGRHFVSHEMGCRKPERAAFELVSREIGVALEGILFFDDTQVNIDGARALGVQAVLVRTPADVSLALAPWLGRAHSAA